MIKNISSQLISPGRVIRGQEAWEFGKAAIPLITKRPLILGRSKATESIRNQIIGDLKKLGLKPVTGTLDYGCCELDLAKIKSQVLKDKCDCIIAAGGGKVLDAGKLIAYRDSLPSITIPLSASTCAGWTALSNIYSPKGAFLKDQVLNSCPNLLIFDHNFARTAPQRTLASGIADALAKWYEASIANSNSNDGIVQQAVQMARVLRDQLLIDGVKAYENQNSSAWTRVAEGCALTAGLIGGFGGASCRTAVAHALHNGLTQIEGSNKSMHGELVCFGILIQLSLEEKISGNLLARQSREQLTPFLKKLNLPITLKDLDLPKLTNKEIQNICEFTLKDNSEIQRLPIKITLKDLLEVVNLQSKEIKISTSN